MSGKERGRGWISHKLIVKLRVFGDPRYSGDYTTRITYPHCSIEEMQVEQEGQLSLPISELALLPPCTNPAVVKYKPRNTKALRQAIQQSLPLFDASAKLHSIAIQKGYPTLSEQTLLTGTIEHWDSNQNKIINLPVAIVELLKEANASLEEQENAIALFQVAGADAALKYIEGLTTLRLLQQPTKGNRNQECVHTQ